MRRDDVERLEAAVRHSNPVPGTGDLATSADAAAVTLLVEQRRRTMTTPSIDTAPKVKEPTTPPRRSMAWAFTAGFIAVLLLVGAGVLFLRGEGRPVAGQSTVEEPPDLIDVDSLTWSRIGLGTTGPRVHIDMAANYTPASSLAEGGPGLVAIGTHSVPAPNDLADGGGGPGWVQGYLDVPTVWTSPDGYEWSQVPSGDDTIGVLDFDGEVAGLAARDGLMVAVAESYAWTSIDAITWSRVPDGTFRYNVDALSGVIAGGPGFVAFGGDAVLLHAAIWTSPDGSTWTRVPDDPAVFTIDIRAMTVGGPGLVALGASHEDCEPVVLTSPDGFSWTRLPPDPIAFGDDPSCGLGGPGQARIRGVTSGGPGLVAVGSYMEHAAVWTSPDGMTWTRVPDDPAVFGVLGAVANTPYSEMTSVAAVGDGLVAVGWRGGGPAVWISHDGFTWTDISDDLDLSGSLFMVQVVEGGPGAVIFGVDQTGGFNDPRPPVESVMWVGSPTRPTG